MIRREITRERFVLGGDPTFRGLRDVNAVAETPS